MSFSSKAKDELCHISAENGPAANAELFAIISTAGNITLSRGGMALKIHFESLPVAKHTYQLLQKYHGVDCEIDVIENKMKKKNTYSLVIEGRDIVMCLLSALGFPKETTLFLSHNPPSDILEQAALRSAFLRGLFLGCGTVSNPKKNYHMEFVLSAKDFAYCILNILKNLKIIAKIVFRKSNYVVYLKSGDDIASLLAAIGAHSAVLELENIRILKEMRNNVNRAVNCETANINKTVDAAVRQLRAIQLIDNKIGIDHLSEPLAEAALLRLNNPEASLMELAELSQLGSTKSGINHRFRKLNKIAEELLSKEDLS
jgi:DNA-binding protein WhiA